MKAHPSDRKAGYVGKWPVLISIATVILAVATYFSEKVDNYPSWWAAIVVLGSGLSLVLLARYVVDTNRMAKTMEEQFHHMNDTNITLDIMKRWQDLYEPISLVWTVSKRYYDKWREDALSNGESGQQPPENIVKLLDKVRTPPETWETKGRVNADAFNPELLGTQEERWVWKLAQEIYPRETSPDYRWTESDGSERIVKFSEFHSARRKVSLELSMFGKTYRGLMREIHGKDQLHLTRLLIWLEYALLQKLGTVEIPTPLIELEKLFSKEDPLR